MESFRKKFGCCPSWVPCFYAELRESYGECRYRFIFTEFDNFEWPSLSFPVLFVAKRYRRSTFTIAMHELVHVTRTRFPPSSYEEYLAYCIAEGIDWRSAYLERFDPRFNRTATKLSMLYGSSAPYILLRLNEDEVLQLANASKNKTKAILASLGLRSILFKLKGIL